MHFFNSLALSASLGEARMEKAISNANTMISPPVMASKAAMSAMVATRNGNCAMNCVANKTKATTVVMARMN